LTQPRPDRNNVPSVYSLETVFGFKEETGTFDPLERILWIAECFQQIQTSVIWSQPEQNISQPNTMITVSPQLQEKVIPVMIDDTSTPGLSMIASGKPVELLESLIFPLDQDISYTQVFLATYRFFISPYELFNTLKHWYEVEKDTIIADVNQRKLKKGIQDRCIRVFIVWINHHWIDFHTHNVLFEQLTTFTDELARDSFSNNQKLVHAIREQRLSWYTLQYVPMFSGGRVNEDGKPHLGEWEIEAFAHNLTMIDHLLFRKLKPDVYFQILFSSGTIDHGAHNVPLKILLEYCQWFRMVYRIHVDCRLCYNCSCQRRIDKETNSYLENVY
jgi:hypothetical protein